MRETSIKEAKDQRRRLRGIDDMPSLIGMIHDLDLPIRFADIDDPVKLGAIINDHLATYIIAAQDRALRQGFWVKLRWLALIFILGAGVGLLNGYYFVFQPFAEKHERVRETLEKKEGEIEKLKAAIADTAAFFQKELQEAARDDSLAQQPAPAVTPEPKTTSSPPMSREKYWKGW